MTKPTTTKSELRIALDRLPALQVEALELAQTFSRGYQQSKDALVAAHFSRLQTALYELHLHLGHTRNSEPEAVRSLT